MASDTSRFVFSPFARIEGDIRIEVAVEGGLVTEARATGTCYRGFEPMLRGRDLSDAMVITPRVCGQCSLSHLAAAAGAIGSLSGAELPRNAFLARAVMLGAETILNHLTHFYLSFAPDLALGLEEGHPATRFRPTSGGAFQAAVQARRELLPLLGLFVGKWPNSLAIQPGGTTRIMDRGDLVRASGVMMALRDFLEARFVGDDLSSWLDLRSESDLMAWLGEQSHADTDVGVFLRESLGRGLDRLGRWPAAFVSGGGVEVERGRRWLRDGFNDGARHPLSLDLVSEHVRYSWFKQAREGAHPARSRTVPAPSRAEAYSWTKAPRYDDRPAEAGPLARMVADGDPLIADLIRTRGAGVLVRELARLHEMLRLAAAVGEWIGAIRPGEAFLAAAELPQSGEGVGIVEAPRGMLGHWVSVSGGKIREYQIVTPTAWNFSPRDSSGTPGPVESALVGTRHGPEVGNRDASLVVKSFDPCLFCAVH